LTERRKTSAPGDEESAIVTSASGVEFGPDRRPPADLDEVAEIAYDTAVEWIHNPDPYFMALDLSSDPEVAHQQWEDRLWSQVRVAVLLRGGDFESDEVWEHAWNAVADAKEVWSVATDFAAFGGNAEEAAIARAVTAPRTPRRKMADILAAIGHSDHSVDTYFDLYVRHMYKTGPLTPDQASYGEVVRELLTTQWAIERHGLNMPEDKPELLVYEEIIALLATAGLLETFLKLGPLMNQMVGEAQGRVLGTVKYADIEAAELCRDDRHRRRQRGAGHCRESRPASSRSSGSRRVTAGSGKGGDPPDGGDPDEPGAIPRWLPALVAILLGCVGLCPAPATAQPGGPMKLSQDSPAAAIEARWAEMLGTDQGEHAAMCKASREKMLAEGTLTFRQEYDHYWELVSQLWCEIVNHFADEGFGENAEILVALDKRVGLDGICAFVEALRRGDIKLAQRFCDLISDEERRTSPGCHNRLIMRQSTTGPVVVVDQPGNPEYRPPLVVAPTSQTFARRRFGARARQSRGRAFRCRGSRRTASRSPGGGSSDDPDPEPPARTGAYDVAMPAVTS
jgi:hypothetical protein